MQTANGANVLRYLRERSHRVRAHTNCSTMSFKAVWHVQTKGALIRTGIVTLQNTLQNGVVSDNACR